jgi:hypothetical protein
MPTTSADAASCNLGEAHYAVTFESVFNKDLFDGPSYPPCWFQCYYVTCRFVGANGSAGGVPSDGGSTP